MQRAHRLLVLASIFLAPALSQAATAFMVRTNDGLALGLDAHGALQEVTAGGAALPLLGPGGFFVSEVTGADVAAHAVVAGTPAVAAWNAVATAGRLALGYQILGAVGQMIDLAVTHARTRVQFGRPIGSFQAVRNRLADAHVAREGAAAALASAWDADDAVLAGLLAKSLAGRAARIAATQCQQVLAGIGFTAEHPFHRFLARALVLDSVLGSAAELPAVIGARLISAGTIPRLVDL